LLRDGVWIPACAGMTSFLVMSNVFMQPINILHVISKLPVGGVENQLLMTLKNYDRMKLYPLVCSLLDKGEIGKEIEDAGIEVIALNKLKHRFDWTIVKDIYRLIKKRNIKIVRTHQYHANLYGRLAGWLAKVPCIVASIHNVYTMDRKLHRRIMNKFLSRFSDKVVAVSETVKKDILKYDGLREDEIIVIYNGIDTDSFVNRDGNAIRREFGIPSDVPVIGTIGRLTFQKGQKYLIEAASKIKEKFPGIMLLIVGDGPMKDGLRNYAKILDLNENVIFTGSRRDIPALLAAMDIFVLPSLWEGLGNALLEAMASGKPIIATDIPPIREIVNSEKVGILVPPQNSNAIADSIEFLFHNKNFAENLANAARERVFTTFHIKTSVRHYTELFENILRNKAWNT
ncbi:MAG: glycosyltransferase, partial [Thermodesulfovibrionales bacterium]